MFERRLLEKMRVGLSERVGPDFARGLEMEPWRIDQFAQGMTMTVSAYVLGEKLGQTEEVARLQVPATWWQHWKFSHGPQWLTKRWPVRWQWVLVDYQRADRLTYPHARALPTNEWGVGVFTWQTRVDYQINATDFELDVVHRTPTPEFLHHHELISTLMRTEAMSPNGALPHPVDYAAIRRVLDGLKELGVNPSQLVIRQNEKF
jgi:hypothetical protein